MITTGRLCWFIQWGKRQFGTITAIGARTERGCLLTISYGDRRWCQRFEDELTCPAFQPETDPIHKMYLREQKL